MPEVNERSWVARYPLVFALPLNMSWFTFTLWHMSAPTRPEPLVGAPSRVPVPICSDGAALSALTLQIVSLSADEPPMCTHMFAVRHAEPQAPFMVLKLGLLLK